MSNRLLNKGLFWALMVSVCSCDSAKMKTVPGPEVATLLPVTAGYVIMQEGGGPIKAVELPSLKETIVRPADITLKVDTPSIHAISGPDSRGRIAYIETYFFVTHDSDKRHLLKTIRLDGTGDTEIFSRPGDAMWAETAAGHGEIGKGLALAPVGSRVAFFSHLSGLQMPGALLYQGCVEIWDLDKRTGVVSNISALDNGLAWFPDGTRLAYVKMIDRKQAAAIAPDNSNFGDFFRNWDKVPAVFVRDINTGTDSFVHIGVDPVVSIDGKAVLVTDCQGHWNKVHLVDKTSADLVLTCGSIVADLGSGVLLAWSFPTAGTKVEPTKYYSPLVGPREMLALKLCRINSNDFQTVVPSIDPRAEVSFGQVK
jgi:hypothetical protein